MTYGHKIPVGVSSCLMGEKVRYDHTHKLNRFITQTLSECFEFHTFCPEMAIGLGVPRAPIKLVEQGDRILVRGIDNPSNDVTDLLVAYADRVVEEVASLRGYIFKSKSPSCGMQNVKVHNAANEEVARGAGKFAEALMKRFPQLPVEEESRLEDEGLRESFLTRVFVYDRWLNLQQKGMTPKALVAFHTRHKFLIQAHHEVEYRTLGKLVAEAGSKDIQTLSGMYLSHLMNALSNLATRESHTNVLMHLLGFIKTVASREKAQFLNVLERYRVGQVPLNQPRQLLLELLKRYPHPYLSEQYYLFPDADELKVRQILEEKITT